MRLLLSRRSKRESNTDAKETNSEVKLYFLEVSALTFIAILCFRFSVLDFLKEDSSAPRRREPARRDGDDGARMAFLRKESQGRKAKTETMRLKVPSPSGFKDNHRSLHSARIWKHVVFQAYGHVVLSAHLDVGADG